MGEWTEGDGFARLERFFDRLVHVESHDCSVEGYLRVADNQALVLERYERSLRHCDGYWEQFPGNQMDRIVLHIPLVAPVNPTYVSVEHPTLVMELPANEIVAETAMDEDYNYPAPPQQVVPPHRIFHYHAVAAVMSALFRNHLAVIHLSYGEQTGADAEFLNSQMSTGLEGRVLHLETVQTACARHIKVTLEVWERHEYGRVFVRRPERPRVVKVAAPCDCRRLERVGSEEIYYLN